MLIFKESIKNMLWLFEKSVHNNEPPRIVIPESVLNEVEQLAISPSKKSKMLSEWLSQTASYMRIRVWSEVACDSKHLSPTLTNLLMEAIKETSETRYLIPVVLFVNNADADMQTVTLPCINQGLSKGAQVVNWHTLSSLSYNQDLTVLSSGAETIQVGSVERLVLEVISPDGVPTWNPESWFQALEEQVLARNGRLMAIVCNPDWWVTALVQSLSFSGSIQQQKMWHMLSCLRQPGMEGFSMGLLEIIARYGPSAALDLRGHIFPCCGVKAALVRYKYTCQNIVTPIKIARF